MERADAEVEVAGEIGGQRLLVELGSADGLPGRMEGHVERGQIEVEHAGDAVGGASRVRSRDQADIEVPSPVAQLDPLALRIGGKSRHAQLGRQRGEVVLGGADPLPAPVDRVPGPGDLGEGAPSDTVPRIEHQDIDPGTGQVTAGGQARVAGPDDHHLALKVVFGHGPFPPMGHGAPRSATIGAGPAGAARTPSVPCGVW